MELAIYKTGSTEIQTTVHNGYADFTAHKNGGVNFTVDEYLAHLGPDFVCIPFDEACKLCDQAQESTFCTPWKEIDADKWTYALEVLPPEKWKRVNSVELFRMSEYTCGIITGHYARIGDRFFYAARKITESYDKLSQEVRDLLI